MIGAIIFAVIVVVAIPVGFLMSTSIVAGIVGELLRGNSERQNADSELLETNF